MTTTQSQSGTARSEALAERARKVIPSGVTHDMRFLRPYPIYIERAQGARKVDVDGNEYVDYWMGHGSLILGHRHPEVIAAVNEAIGRATHAGGCHDLEVEWAERVVELIPSVERVRFTSSGTEATMLAMRVARAYSGKDRIVKFAGHFHGWHDYATYGVNPPYETPTSIGVPGALDQTMSVIPPDLDRLRVELTRDDVGGVVLEPTGASMGAIPVDAGFLAGVRAACDEAGVPLIVDEVITGFRYAPGGAQELTGVEADLTALGKVLAGGLPGGALAGRGELMDLIAFTEDEQRNRFERVPHTGTFNASPPVAAAGSTTLGLIADGEACRIATERATALREGMIDAVERLGAPWRVYGEASIFHWLPAEPVDPQPGSRGRSIRDPTASEAMRNALLRNGVDMPGYEGWVSAAHTEEDVERSIEGFAAALEEVGRS
jgi:glutamate-1-semialdehyde 2,1-aminomutase